MAADGRKKPPAFQFYPADWLADAKVRSMSFAERGVYIDLLCYCWREGSIPAGERALARLVGIDLPSLRAMWPALVQCFEPTGNGHLVQPRLERQRQEQEAFAERQRLAGQEGGFEKARRGDREPVNAESKRLARELRRQGLTLREIAQQLGVHHRTVDRWVSRLPVARDAPAHAPDAPAHGNKLRGAPTPQVAEQPGLARRANFAPVAHSSSASASASAVASRTSPASSAKDRSSSQGLRTGQSLFATWPADLDWVKEILQRFKAPEIAPDLCDAEFIRGIREMWQRDPDIEWDTELANYLAWHEERRKHKNRRRGFKRWLKEAKSRARWRERSKR